MKNILFVCTGNSARSIIAESIINNEYSNKFKAYSAGSNPTGKINEDVKRFLEKNKNYDLFEYRSKNFEDFLSNNIKIDSTRQCVVARNKCAIHSLAFLFVDVIIPVM